MADAQINHQDARDYWQSIDADVNGMLGGFPYISRVDLQGSKNFLAKLGVGGKGKGKIERAVDCGAGWVCLNSFRSYGALDSANRAITLLF